MFAALDNKLFEQSLDQICEYATTTTRANAVDAIGELVRNLASASGDKTFAKLFPLAKQRITQELRAGASSTRTTTTSIPLPADAALHWWQSILYGMLIPGRINVSIGGKPCVSKDADTVTAICHGVQGAIHRASAAHGRLDFL